MEETLGANCSTDQAHIPESEYGLDITVGALTVTEVNKAIQ